MLRQGLFVTSKFEVVANTIVITKAVDRLNMAISIQLGNIEEEQKTDKATAKHIAKIIRFLRNIED
jgi:hypothetical protein